MVFFAEPIHDRERIRAWYCRADLFLFPSTFDTNGLVVREAAACSLPSVLIVGSCAAEDVTDGVSGFLIEENAAGMAAKLEELCKQPEALKAVGEGALRELYLSWEDAVANACRRYEVVIDNYRAGKYPVHAGLTDELIHNIAQAMDGYNQSRDRQKARMRELTDSYRKLRGDIMAEGQRRLDQMQSAPDRLSAGWEAEQARLTEELRAREQQLRSRFDELARYLDRFM